jgi:ADP-heptose:LPS heptosyltransferase
MKRVLVIRYGAFGDAVQITPLLRALKSDGYHVTAQVIDRTYDVLKHCPWVDKFLLHQTDSVPNEQLKAYWEELGRGYDKVINLTGSIEGSLLVTESHPLWKLDHEDRHAILGETNYIDRIMSFGGYPERTGELPELHFTPLEHEMARTFRRKHKDKFLMLWSMSGSSFHKTWPHAAYAATAFLEAHPDAMTVSVGDSVSCFLEWSHPRARCYSGVWPIRRSLLMTQYADVVIGAETGVLNAAACYETPKVLMLSHSSEMNLSQYWKNCHAIVAQDVSCYPCHKLHYKRESCPTDPISGAALCAAEIQPQTVLNTLEVICAAWKECHYALAHR